MPALPAPCPYSPAPCPAALRDHRGGGRIPRPRVSSRRELAMTPLRRRMTDDLVLHDRSPGPIRLYVNWVADFARHFHTSPEHLGPEHVRSYLLHLVQERQASCYVQKQARLALKFLYRVTLGREWVVEKVACPKAPRTLPVVLSRDEMTRFLDAVGSSRETSPRVNELTSNSLM